MKEITISRSWARPSAWTFTIKPIADLITRYVGNGMGWVDPFAGNNSPAELTNDQNPLRRAAYHMDAEKFCLYYVNELKRGVLFDPPYSPTQISEHYKTINQKVRFRACGSNFYSDVMNAISNKIEIGGYAITFGWNTNGFGTGRGFQTEEILIVAHGWHHNDTLVTVERKYKQTSQAAKIKKMKEQIEWFYEGEIS